VANLSSFFGSTPPELVVTSGITIDPAGPYKVGQTLTAEFTVTNNGTSAITLERLLAGGRLGSADDCAATNRPCPDFTIDPNVTIGAKASHRYRGTFTPAEPGSYKFEVFYLQNGDWHLNLPTDGGGNNLVNIEVEQAPEVGATAHSPLQALQFSGQGFDKCEIPGEDAMQTWMDYSPYRVVNLYIGGNNRTCSNPTLTSSFVSRLAEQGWKFIPTWVGPQASCLGPRYLRMSQDPGIAFNEGITEAKSAIQTAHNLGFASTVIYYDLENYDTRISACREAAKSFISGWSSHLQANGFPSGVYGSSCASAISDFANIENPPDAVWLANWIQPNVYRPGSTVWNVSCVPEQLWSNNQRIRQYAGGHTETWGGVTFKIDSNVIDGLVADLAETQTASSPLPDLTISAAVNNSYQSGQREVQIPVTVSRTGGSIIEGTYVLARLFWSRDRVWDSGDMQLWERNGSRDFPITLLNGGSRTSLSATTTVNIPTVRGAGTYSIIAFADANEFQSEIDEANNTKAYEVRIVTPEYTLTTAANPSTGGSVTGAGTFGSGTQVTLSNFSNSGWFFTSWSGDCFGSSSCAVTMDGDKHVTANLANCPRSPSPRAAPGPSPVRPPGFTAGPLAAHSSTRTRW
jgi:hypothetical protein